MALTVESIQDQLRWAIRYGIGEQRFRERLAGEDWRRRSAIDQCALDLLHTINPYLECGESRYNTNDTLYRVRLNRNRRAYDFQLMAELEQIAPHRRPEPDAIVAWYETEYLK